MLRKIVPNGNYLKLYYLLSKSSFLLYYIADYQLTTKSKMSRLYEEYNKNQLLFTMSQIALFLVNTG